MGDSAGQPKSRSGDDHARLSELQVSRGLPRITGRFDGVDQLAGLFERQVVWTTDAKSPPHFLAEIQLLPLGDRVNRANLVRGRSAWAKRSGGRAVGSVDI